MSDNKKENKKQKKVQSYNRIPTQVEIFGRIIKTYDDSIRLNAARNFGEARYGVNQIALATDMNGSQIPEDELKLTYLHELMHFITYLTGFEKTLSDKGIDLEQFVDLFASALYQYEKSAKY